MPLKPHTSISTWGRNSRFTGIAIRWNSLAPSRIVHESLFEVGRFDRDRLQARASADQERACRGRWDCRPDRPGQDDREDIHVRSRGLFGSWRGACLILMICSGPAAPAPVATKVAAAAEPLVRKPRRVVGWSMFGSRQ